MNEREFRELVSREMDEIGRSRGLANVGDKFSVWFTTRILGESEGSAAETYRIGGAGDEKVDVGISDEDHNVNLIVQCKFSEHPFTFSRDVIDETLNALRRVHDAPGIGNDRRKDFARRVNDSEKPTLLIAACLGTLTTETKEYALNHGVQVYDLVRTRESFEYLTIPGNYPVPNAISLRLLKPEIPKHTRSGQLQSSTPADGGRHRQPEAVPELEAGSSFELWTFLADMKGIYAAVRDNRDGMFQANLRFRLTGRSEGRIGSQIQGTIRKGADLVLALNNGITIVCQEFVGPSNDEITLVRPQIVNGGQTAWAIHDVCKELEVLFPDYYSTLRVPILIKAIKTSNDRLVARITEATNNQNPITKRDERADRHEQTELRRAFDRFRIGGASYPVLFEHKRGQFEVVARSAEQGRYRIRGNLFRRLDNEFAAQLYLALLGLPNRSKNDKRQVFESDSTYKTVFGVGRPLGERFTNEQLGLDVRSLLVSGATADDFVSDATFGMAVYQLADAYASCYSRRLGEWPAPDQISNQYKILAAHQFVRLWQYYVVHGLNYVVFRLAQGNPERRNVLRESLVGREPNRWFSTDLRDAFTLASGTDNYLILSESSPSSEFPLFGRWVASLSTVVYEQVQAAKAKPDWKSERHYFDLRADTVQEINSKLDEILGGPKAKRESWFPPTA